MICWWVKYDLHFTLQIWKRSRQKHNNIIIWKIIYQHTSSSSQVPDDCPRALQPAEQAQSPKKHRKPASLVTMRLIPTIANKKSFILYQELLTDDVTRSFTFVVLAWWRLWNIIVRQVSFNSFLHPNEPTQVVF